MNITRHSRSLFRFLRISATFRTTRTTVTLLNNTKFHQIKEIRNFSSVFSKSPDYNDQQQMDLAVFEPVCTATLDALTEYFEEIVEADEKLTNGDVAYSDGVLTIKLGSNYGTYVINRQTPNRQIWLSSPTSGPKRYDFIDGDWIYKHDGVSLHQLLQDELSKIMSNSVDFLSLTKK